MTGQPSPLQDELPEGIDSLLMCLPGGLVFTSGTGRILKANDLFLEWLGYRRNEVENQLRLVDLLDAGGRIFYETHIALLLKVNRELNSVALDFVGRSGEVIPVLVQFLDDAVLLSQHELRILHGKGEGVLRSVIRDQLKQTRGVSSFADEHVERGGAGITVVVLK